MNTDNIPEELKSLDQWVCAWDHNKCPMSPYGYEGASSSNPETWGSFHRLMVVLNRDIMIMSVLYSVKIMVW